MSEPVAPTPQTNPSIGVVAAPALAWETVARLLTQSIEEQQSTRLRLDAHVEISSVRFSGLEKQLDGIRDTTRAQYLTLSNDIADVRKHVGAMEEHIGFLTAKVTEHDTRFDRVDARFDQIDQRLDAHDTRFDHIDQRLDTHDTRFDQIDQRLDAHDTRFDHIDQRLDAHDTRFDHIDQRLDTLTSAVLEIHEALLPPAQGEGVSVP